MLKTRNSSTWMTSLSDIGLAPMSFITSSLTVGAYQTSRVGIRAWSHHAPGTRLFDYVVLCVPSIHPCSTPVLCVCTFVNPSLYLVRRPTDDRGGDLPRSGP